MNRCFDELTYRYPRTVAEVISRYPCNGQEAVACSRHRQPIAVQVYRGIVGGLLCSGALGLMLAYFDILA